MSTLLACPSCGGRATSVKDVRAIRTGLRRRRECSGCGHRFTTYEAIGEPRDCTLCGDLKRKLAA